MIRLTDRDAALLMQGIPTKSSRRRAQTRPQADAVTGSDAIYFMGLSRHNPEDRLQIGFMRWVEATHNDIFQVMMASAGGLRTSMSQGMKMKSMGYKRGTPDIFLAVPRGGKHGLFLELKSAIGRPSPDQLLMIQTLQQHGYAAAIVNSFAAAKAALTAYLREEEI